MKKLLVLTMALVMSFVLQAQEATKIDSVTQQVKKTVEVIQEGTSWGREIGVAVDEALGAIEEHVISLSESSLGHTVIFLVCWRFMYKDVIGILVGLIFIVILIWLIRKTPKIFKSQWFQDIRDGEVQIWIIVGVFGGLLAFFIASLACIFG